MGETRAKAASSSLPSPSSSNSTNSTAKDDEKKDVVHHHFVRGVNIGGWLLLERYITPYLFALTDCHLWGDLCWYPGQLSAPRPSTTSDRGHHPRSGDPDEEHRSQYCDRRRCKPSRREYPELGGIYDYPLDEYTLGSAFREGKVGGTNASLEAGERWLNHHFDNFVSREDLQKLRDAGVAHVRVPLPHWILGDVAGGEPWIVGDRWKYFVRFCKWCRELGIEVWPDLHTAPGSQNGFDNSGQSLMQITCRGWSASPANVNRTLHILERIGRRIVDEDLQDVVTGFGLLNEPFKDCTNGVYERYIDKGLELMRGILGNDTAIYVTDMFLAKTFNDGHWKWLGLNNATAAKYNNSNGVPTA